MDNRKLKHEYVFLIASIVVLIGLPIVLLWKTSHSVDEVKFSAQTRVVSTIYPTNDTIVANYTIDSKYINNEELDASEAINEAMAECYNNGGGTVYLPAGKYYLKSSIGIATLCTLRGDYQDPDNYTGTLNYGTILVVGDNVSYTHKVEERLSPEQSANKCFENDCKGLITMSGSSGVNGLTIYYKDQSITNNEAKDYPWTFYIPGGALSNFMTIKNVTLINSYRGIGRSLADTPPFTHTGLMISNVKGTSLFRGLLIHNSSDVGTVDGLSLNASYWANANRSVLGGSAVSKDTISGYMKTHGSAGLTVTDAEQQQYYNVSIKDYYVGVYFPNAPTRYMGSGLMYHFDITNCSFGIYADAGTYGDNLTNVDYRWGYIISNSRIQGETGDIYNLSTKVGSNVATFKLSNVELSSTPKINYTYSDAPGIVYSSYFDPGIGNPAANGELAYYYDYANYNNSASGIRFSDSRYDYTVDTSVIVKNNGTGFEVIGNGSGNITSELNSAISRITNSGGIVYVKPGNYTLTSTIQVPANVEIRGAASSESRIFDSYNRTNNNQNDPKVATSFTISGDMTAFKLVGNHAGLYGIAIFNESQFNQFVSDMGNGIYNGSYEASFAVTASNVSDVYVVNSVILGAYNGILFENCDRHIISNFVSGVPMYPINVSGGTDGKILNCFHNMATMVYMNGLATGQYSGISGNIGTNFRDRPIFIHANYTKNEMLVNNFAYGIRAVIVAHGAKDLIAINTGADFLSGTDGSVIKFIDNDSGYHQTTGNAVNVSGVFGNGVYTTESNRPYINQINYMYLDGGNNYSLNAYTHDKLSTYGKYTNPTSFEVKGTNVEVKNQKGTVCYSTTAITSSQNCNTSVPSLSNGVNTIYYYVSATGNYNEKYGSFNIFKGTTSSVQVVSNSSCTNPTYNGSIQQIVSNAATGFSWDGTIKYTNAGNYDVTAKLSEGYIWSDGTIGNKTITCSIKKKDITITAKDQTITEGNSISTGVSNITVSGLASGERVASITLTANSANTEIIPSNAKMYDDVPNETTGNYNITYQKGNLTVTAPVAPTCPTTSSYSGAYDDSNHTIGVSGGENGTIEYSTSANGPWTTTKPNRKEVGETTVYIRIRGSSTVDCGNRKITITKRGLTVKANNQTINYGGAITLDDVTVTGLVSGHRLSSIKLTPSTSEVTTNGTITPSNAKILDGSNAEVNGNYDITYQAGNLTILAPVAPTCPTTSDYSSTYDGSSHTISVSGGADGTIEYRTSANGTWTTTMPNRTDVGETIVYVQIRGSSTVDCGSKKITIAKKNITVKANDQTINYGSAITLDDVTVTGLVSGHRLSSITLTPSTSEVTTNGSITPTNAKISSGSNVDVTSNYNVSYSNGVLVIKGVETVCPTLSAYSGNYDGSTHYITVTGGSGGTIQYRDNQNGEWSDSRIGRADAGVSTVYVKVKATQGGQDKDCGNSTITINPKSLSVPSSPQDKIYTGSEINSGINCPSGSSASGDTKKTDVGTYTQVCTLLNENYKWSDNTTEPKNITWKIVPKTITITADNKTISVGGTPSYSYSYSNVSQNELNNMGTVSYRITNNSGQTVTPNAVGTYNIVPSGLNGGRNYTINYVKGTLTVVDDKKGTCDMNSTKALKATKQTLTLECSDDVGIVKYYFGKENNANPNTNVNSTAKMTIKKTVEEAGTYYLIAQDSSGNITNRASIEIISYTAGNVLEKVDGVSDSYTSNNYEVLNSNNYIIPVDTVVQVSSLYSIPKDISSVEYKGYSLEEPSTSKQELKNETTMKVSAGSQYYFWFNRGKISITIENKKCDSVVGSGEFKYGREAKIRAIAGSNKVFKKWEVLSGNKPDNINSSTATITLTEPTVINAICESKDGSITEEDIKDLDVEGIDPVKLALYIIDGKTDLDNEALTRGDVNGDGVIKMNDVMMIVKANKK